MLALKIKFGKTISVRSSKDIQAEVTKITKKSAQELVQLGFKTETDPYGNRWPLKKKKDGKPTLVHTGKMKKNFRYKGYLTRVSISNAKKYSIYHLTGIPNKNMPPRIFMPFKKSSKIWNNYILRMVDKKLKRIIR